MISSPMVLTTEPPCCSVARRMISMQIETLSRAAMSPSSSNSRVLPTTSAKRIASSWSCPIELRTPAADYIIRIIGRKQTEPPKPRRLPSSSPAPQEGGTWPYASIVRRNAGHRHVVRAFARAAQCSMPTPPREPERLPRGIGRRCLRHAIGCIVWCMTDRCLHVVIARGSAVRSALATRRTRRPRPAPRPRPLDGRQAGSLPARSRAPRAAGPGARRTVRRAIDWPHSSARETCGYRPAPAWLDPTPLYELLGRATAGASTVSAGSWRAASRRAAPRSISAGVGDARFTPSLSA